MKRILLLPIGLIPLVAGYGINYLMMYLNIYGMTITLISFVFLVIWFFIGYYVGNIKASHTSVIGFSLAFGILNYIYIVYQLLIMESWSGNVFGMMSQFYILPSLGLVWEIDLFNVFNRPFGYSTCAMIFLLLVFCIGFYLRRGRINVNVSTPKTKISEE